MRHYHREDMRHLNDGERYRDYDYLGDDGWIGANERAPHGTTDPNEPPWSTMGPWESSPFAARRAFDDRGQGREYGRDFGLGYGRESDPERHFERSRTDDYDRGYARPREVGEHQHYERETSPYGVPQQGRGAPEDRVRDRIDVPPERRRFGLRGVIDTIFHPAQALRSVLFRGKGPKNWVRSDARIYDDVCMCLEHDDAVDATDIEALVRDGEVTLSGFVPTRAMRYHAEDIVSEVLGVKDVHNYLRLRRPTDSGDIDEERGNRTGTSGSRATSTTVATRR